MTSFPKSKDVSFSKYHHPKTLALNVPNNIDDLTSFNWENEDLKNFYEKIPITTFRDYAIEGGFEDGCDVDLAYPYLQGVNSIMDLSAGYGRVTKRLISRGYQGKIYMVERSRNLCKYLENNFSSRAKIIHQDIRTFTPKFLVDAILWMWSGIGDFSKEEQLPILERISSWLKPHGTLVLETILHTSKPNNATSNEGQSFAITTEYGSLCGYKTSAEEIQQYGEQLGYKYIKHINYSTTKNRPRVLHILSNAIN